MPLRHPGFKRDRGPGGIDEDGVPVLAELFGLERHAVHPVTRAERIIAPVIFLRHGAIVNIQDFIVIGDLVAGQAGHALDERHVRVFGVAENHNIAPRRGLVGDEFGLQHRQAQAIVIFIDQDKIPDQQGRHHRGRGDFERLKQKGTQQQHGQEDREEGFSIFHDQRELGARRRLVACPVGVPGLGREKGRLSAAREAQPIHEPDQAAYKSQKDQQGRKIKIHLSRPTCRMAMKAACGIATEPNCFMRFLPAFCFSSSLRLRVTSPP